MSDNHQLSTDNMNIKSEKKANEIISYAHGKITSALFPYLGVVTERLQVLFRQQIARQIPGIQVITC